MSVFSFDSFSKFGVASRLLAALTLSLSASACRKSNPETTPPGSEAWAVALDKKLQAQPDSATRRRDRALLSSAFLPGTPDPARYKELSNQALPDALSAYALGLRAMRSRDLAGLMRASEALMAFEVQAFAQGSKPTRKLRFPATTQVLSWLWDLIQDQPQKHDFIDKLWANFEGKTLGPVTRRALLSLVGKSRRQGQKPFRFAYQAQGCVQDWRTGAVQGLLGELSLYRAKLPLVDLEAQKDAEVFGLACATRVWNPSDNSGYRVLESEIEVGDQGLLLSLTTPAMARIFLDGQEIWRRDGLDKIPSRSREFWVDAKKGTHRLQIALAIPGEKTWMMVRATDTLGRALPHRAPKGKARPASGRLAVQRWDQDPQKACKAQLMPPQMPEPSLAQPWVEHCALYHALSQHDWEEAYVQQSKLQDYERFAEALALLGESGLQNPELSRNQRQSLARQYLEEAVARDPALLELSLSLAQSQIDRGEEKEVREALRKKNAPTHIEDALFRFGVYLGVGNELRADRMLERAKKLDPDHCEFIAASFRRARDLDARKRQAELLPKLLPCPGGRGLALRFWMGRGEHERAMPLVQELLDEQGDDLSNLRIRADLWRAQGQEAKARQDQERILKLKPGSMRSHIFLADQERVQGNEKLAFERLSRLSGQYPNQNHVRRYLESLGKADPLLSHRQNAKAIIGDYEATQAKKPRFVDDASVFLLDRDYVEVYRDGSQRHLIHQIVRLQSKEAIDAFGEIEVPQEAELLRLRTIKADGRVIEPERITGKSSYSMRALEVGDYVEQEWIMPADRYLPPAGSTDLGLFRFASTKAPFIRSELLVRAPKSMNLQFERRAGAPEATIREDATAREWSFVARDKPRVVPEPSTPPLADQLPQVRVFAQLRSEDWLEDLAAKTLWAQRRGPALRSFLREILSAHASPQEAVAAIHQAVHERIEAEGSLARSAGKTLSEGKGNRTTLMAALLREAKIPARILLARSRFATPIRAQGHPQFESYDTPILEIWPQDSKRRRYLLADLPFAPIGYLPEWFEGAQAHPIHAFLDGQVGEALKLGRGLIQQADLRSYHLDVKLAKDGSATIQGKLVLRGLTAAQWRQALKQTDPERREELFSRFEQPRLLPGVDAQLASLKILNETSMQKALVMRFVLKSNALARVHDKLMRMSTQLLRLNSGAGLATLAERKLDLLVPTSARQKASVRIELPPGASWSIPAQGALDHNLKSEYGSYRQQVTLGKGRLQLQIESGLKAQVVPKERYPAFLSFVQKVASAQAQRVDAKL